MFFDFVKICLNPQVFNIFYNDIVMCRNFLCTTILRLQHFFLLFVMCNLYFISDRNRFSHIAAVCVKFLAREKPFQVFTKCARALNERPPTVVNCWLGAAGDCKLSSLEQNRVEKFSTFSTTDYFLECQISLYLFNVSYFGRVSRVWTRDKNHEIWNSKN